MSLIIHFVIPWFTGPDHARLDAIACLVAVRYTEDDHEITSDTWGWTWWHLNFCWPRNIWKYDHQWRYHFDSDDFSIWFERILGIFRRVLSRSGMFNPLPLLDPQRCCSEAWAWGDGCSLFELAMFFPVCFLAKSRSLEFPKHWIFFGIRWYWIFRFCNIVLT